MSDEASYICDSCGEEIVVALRLAAVEGDPTARKEHEVAA
jgi:hypothetical protein